MTAGAHNNEREGDRIIPLSDQYDLVPDRSGNKIEHRDQRFSEREKRGRS